MMQARHSLLISIALLLLSLVTLSNGTHIATFSDEECKNSLQDLDGPNGYPNGTCMRIDRKGRFGSFQVTDTDAGCSGKEKVLITEAYRTLC